MAPNHRDLRLFRATLYGWLDAGIIAAAFLLGLPVGVALVWACR
jgi:hypothetical protein